MKLLFLVLDGAPDGFKGESCLEKAIKPNLDGLASESLCGLMYTVGSGYAPESDVAVMSILGYNPHSHYTGRGPIEAVGAGLEFRDGWLALRANFATVDESFKIIDRRAGRDIRPEEAKELASLIDGMRIDECEVRIKATIGHRAVVVFRCEEKLCGEISNTDPAYERVGRISTSRKEYIPFVAICKPLLDDERAKLSAKLVNEFTRRCYEILDSSEVNERRRAEGRLAANILLMRDAGSELPKVEPINKKFRRSFGFIAEMPVEKGIARVLDMSAWEVPSPTGNLEEDLPSRAEATLALMETVDVAYVHLKGPDIYGHDGDLEGKIKSIELIDSLYVGPVMEKLEGSAVLVTSDHSTPWYLRSHSDDPVPTILRIPGMRGDLSTKFSEKSCKNGSLGIIDHGWMLLPMVFKKLEMKEG